MQSFIGLDLVVSEKYGYTGLDVQHASILNNHGIYSKRKCQNVS